MRIRIFVLVIVISFLHALQAQLFFKPTTYKGAFGAVNWTTNWTNWNSANSSYPAGTVVVDKNITSNTTWTSDKSYLLKGYIYVTDAATLKIEPGTIIRCDANTTAALIITRNSKINAVGSELSPIVFTSSKAAGSRNYGDWGGLVILGNAKINVAGGNADIGAGINNGNGDGIYGGSVDDDSSGALDFVRIEFAGVQYQPDKEIGGLTLAGVGSKTQIKHVQLSYCGNDALKLLGGTAQVSYIISSRCFDTDIFMDLGYRGKIQFAAILRDSSKASATGFSSIEVQNDGLASSAQPYTDPTLSNFTILGPMTRATTMYSSNYRNGLHIKRNARLAFFNSAIAGYPKGVLLDGSGCGKHLKDGYILIENCILAGNKLKQGDTSGNFSATVPGFDFNIWFNQFERYNTLLSAPTDLMLKSPYTYSNPDLTTLTISPLANGASFLNHRLSALNNISSGFNPIQIDIYTYNGTLHISGIPREINTMQITVFDLQGKILFTQTTNPTESSEAMQLPLSKHNLVIVRVEVDGKQIIAKKLLFD